MSLQQKAQELGHVRIGRYQSWFEDGKLKLYYHQFGSSTGISCTFSPEETKGLLEMLTNHSDDIESAVQTSESKPAFGKHYSLV